MIANGYCQVKVDRGLTVVRLGDGSLQLWLNGSRILKNDAFGLHMGGDKFRRLIPISQEPSE